VPALGLSRDFTTLVGEPQLERRVSVAIGRTDLKDGARAALEDSDGDGRAIILIDLSHADLAA
jgi:hypothetical protein